MTVDDRATAEPRTPRPASAGPLQGLRVIEMGQLIAGPFCGQILGDLGAEVIKLEQPGIGDPLREWGRTRPQGESLWWSVVGRNKKSVTVNLRTPEGQGIARTLISRSDIVVENFRPGTLERWGLGYEQLSAENPGLILARVSGFGQTGPYSSRAGYGSIGEAMGGLRYVVGDPSTPPSRVGISIGDTLAAVFAAIGTLGAVYERTRSGRGQVVDSAIYEAVLGIMESIVPEWVISGYQRERSGAILPNVAPSNVYPTADGGWVLIAANQNTVFARLAEAMGTSGLATDPRYSTHGARGERQEELDAMVGKFTLQHDARALEELLLAHSVPVGKIYRPEDMLGDEQFIARKSIITTPHPTLGEVPMQNTFPRLSRTDGSVRWPGPKLSEHTDEILTTVGEFTHDAITAFRADGTI
ncbi:CaiB/BaiF CoA transferase family protein [Rhodococcoides fascians]|uniref:CaiB/BaiF CoA transferase family protein n=1 Tax=Rhodococcoides fascians TaxID=1828 RepID=UPI0007AAE380|nr:CoA transferase [Rhodococcus fascians]AMY52611.1 Succinyl-CoA--L-malate CoA-transferase beta subunit [Rhodococcus fascians D188]